MFEFTAFLVSFLLTLSNLFPEKLRSIWLILSGRGFPTDDFFVKPVSTAEGRLRNPSPEVNCPFEYIIALYGKHHFARIVEILNPTLRDNDPEKWELILDIMDAVHFAAILVDDIADNSPVRKGKPAAHTIFGSIETNSRAYTVLNRVQKRVLEVRPSLLPAVIRNVAEIHEGQDMTLVWRRDGPSSLPKNKEDAIAAYRRSAWLKTGALFRLVGQLVHEDFSGDELMSRLGWYTHLQNDCKNVYSEDYFKAKGVAEDIRNGELSYPIVLTLHTDAGREPLLRCFGGSGSIREALEAVNLPKVRDRSLRELEEVKDSLPPEYSEAWGRKERMK